MFILCFSIFIVLYYIMCQFYGGKAQATFLLFLICFGIYQHKQRGKVPTKL